MSKLYLRLNIFCLCLLPLGISGCGLLQAVGIGKSPPPPPVTPTQPPPPPPPLSEQALALTLILRADQAINPDASGRPSPVRVRIFMTEPDSPIESSSFENVFGSGNAAINESPVETLTLRPGERQQVSIDTTRNRTRLTVAAAYRDPHSTHWLKSLKLPALGQLEVTLQLTPLGIEAGLVR